MLIRVISHTYVTLEPTDGICKDVDASATLDTRVLIAPSRRVLHHVVYMVHATMVRAAVRRTCFKSEFTLASLHLN